MLSFTLDSGAVCPCVKLAKQDIRECVYGEHEPRQDNLTRKSESIFYTQAASRVCDLFDRKLPFIT